MKLHVGCGTVYLKGWVNVDVPGPTVFMAEDRPDLVEKYETTEDMYYAKHDGSLNRFRAGPRTAETVCDRQGTFHQLPVGRGMADEIMSRQVFEHMDIPHAHEALFECTRALRDGGILRIDVPDTIDTLNQLALTGDRFFVRHFIGPVSKGDWGYHCMAYTRESLRTLVELHGFEFVEEEPNIHSYPAFMLRFRKCKPN